MIRTMKPHPNLIDELESTVAAKDIRRRAEMLRRVADLFDTGSARFSGDQIALFDDVMTRLLDEIDVAARAAFGRRLCAAPNAPPNTLRALALDDAIEVSGPILSQSMQLTEGTLIEGATTKSQDHLLAISRRASLSELVTDVLVERGNGEVARSTAANNGARFSERGYSTLARRARTDERLAVCVWLRPEVPRRHLLKIFADASEAVRRKLAAVDPTRGQLFRDMLAKASNRVQAKAREGSPEYAAAYSHVRSLRDAGGLGETQLAAFANAGKFDETSIALALMCDVPIGLTERVMAQERSEEIILIARASGFSWDTARAILTLQAEAKAGAAHELDRHRATFAELKPDTAKKAIGFYRLREQMTLQTIGDSSD
jgi:uncharacterized protein (DUF2336 family)